MSKYASSLCLHINPYLRINSQAVETERIVSSVVMEQKITTVRAREGDWLSKALRTQLELERVWERVEREEGYSMGPVSLETEEEGVRIVCLSDTHSMQSSIKFSIPDGNTRPSISLIYNSTSQETSSYTLGTSHDTAWSRRFSSSMSGWPPSRTE